LPKLAASGAMEFKEHLNIKISIKLEKVNKVEKIPKRYLFD